MDNGNNYVICTETINYKKLHIPNRAYMRTI